MENETLDRAGETKKEEPEVLQFTGDFEHDRKLMVSSYMRELQKKSARKRMENDPNTYKKMRALREEKKEDLTIKVE